MRRRNLRDESIVNTAQIGGELLPPMPTEMVGTGVESLANTSEVLRNGSIGGTSGCSRRRGNLSEMLGVREIPSLGDDLGHLLGLPLPAGLLLVVVHGLGEVAWGWLGTHEGVGVFVPILQKSCRSSDDGQTYKLQNDTSGS